MNKYKKKCVACFKLVQFIIVSKSELDSRFLM